MRVVTAAALVTALSLPAIAQTVCGERDRLLDRLSSSYSEAPVSMGLVSNEAVLEVLASQAGSWTMIVTRPNGMSCVVGTGEAWTDLPRLALGPGA